MISLYSIHFFNWCYFFNIVYSYLNCASEEIFQTITSILFVRSNRQLIKIDSLSNVINLYLKIALNLRESRTMVLMLLHNKIPPVYSLGINTALIKLSHTILVFREFRDTNVSYRAEHWLKCCPQLIVFTILIFLCILELF